MSVRAKALFHIDNIIILTVHIDWKKYEKQMWYWLAGTCCRMHTRPCVQLLSVFTVHVLSCPKPANTWCWFGLSVYQHAHNIVISYVEGVKTQILKTLLLIQNQLNLPKIINTIIQDTSSFRFGHQGGTLSPVSTFTVSLSPGLPKSDRYIKDRMDLGKTPAVGCDILTALNNGRL